MDKLTQYLNNCADDIKERYRKALEIIGKDDFTYTKAHFEKSGEVTDLVVFSGFSNLPKKYQESAELREMLKYGLVPYALVEQNNLLNWLIIKSNADFETNDSERVDMLSLPRRISEKGVFWGRADVYNFAHDEYGYEEGAINFAQYKEGFVRIK